MTDSNEVATPDEGGSEPVEPHEDSKSKAVESGLVEEIFEGVVVDDNTREELGHRIEMVFGQVQSPVPPPFMMRDYADLLPDAPERLFKMAEDQSSHRRGLESRVVDGAETRASRGQHYAFIVALAFLVVSGLLIWHGEAVAGTILGTVDLVALVSVFLVGQGKQEREADRRRAATEVEPPSPDSNAEPS